MRCLSKTGASLRDHGTGRDADRLVWSGPDGEIRVPCNYDAPTPEGLLAHLICTHELTLDEARRTVASWNAKVAV